MMRRPLVAGAGGLRLRWQARRRHTPTPYCVRRQAEFRGAGGRLASRRFLGFYLKDGIVRAAIGLNRAGYPEDSKRDGELNPFCGA